MVLFVVLKIVKMTLDFHTFYIFSFLVLYNTRYEDNATIYCCVSHYLYIQLTYYHRFWLDTLSAGNRANVAVCNGYRYDNIVCHSR